MQQHHCKQFWCSMRLWFGFAPGHAACTDILAGILMQGLALVCGSVCLVMWCWCCDHACMPMLFEAGCTMQGNLASAPVLCPRHMLTFLRLVCGKVGPLAAQLKNMV